MIVYVLLIRTKDQFPPLSALTYLYLPVWNQLMDHFDLKKNEIITVKAGPVILAYDLRKWQLEASPLNSVVFFLYSLYKISCAYF